MTRPTHAARRRHLPSATRRTGPSQADDTLARHGIRRPDRVFWNLGVPALYEEALRRREGHVAQGGALVVRTGQHTGRSPNDKFIVQEPSSEQHIWWGTVNRPFEPRRFDRLHARVLSYLQGQDLFVQDCSVGADPAFRHPIRVITETAWHSLFARTMFIPPPVLGPASGGAVSESSAGRARRLVGGGHTGGGMPQRDPATSPVEFTPPHGSPALECGEEGESPKGDSPKPRALARGAGFTVLHAPNFHAEPERDGTASSTFILVHFGKRLILIGGTSYAGEIKKSVFTIMNYLLPLRRVLSMHCAANIGPSGDVAIFFGLSGTGKTSLSADSRRTLIGDDEHGWSDRGVFNIEDGCYAKMIRLSPEAEPEIYATTRRFGTVLENVLMDPASRWLDLNDDSLTENTRGSYPITFIPNASATRMAAHPANIIMLTCDAFGVMPPIAKLTREQAMYHFLSGYTAKVAGTERGITEPRATFSACFGAPFMALRPSVYADLLGEKIARHQVACWLISTGWTGGPYGVGNRIKISDTRAMVEAALRGALAEAPTRPDPLFGFATVTRCPGVPDEVLDPRASWVSSNAYDAKAKELAAQFEENFQQFAQDVPAAVREAGSRGPVARRGPGA